MSPGSRLHAKCFELFWILSGLIAFGQYETALILRSIRYWLRRNDHSSNQQTPQEQKLGSPMKWFLPLMLMLALPTLANPSATQVPEAFSTAWETPLLGAWLNESGGDRVGLDLRPGGECSLSIERALRSPSDRDCTYEPFEDRYLIFLMNDQGLCDGNADFEFIFHPDLPLITLIVGNAQIDMNRLQP